MLSYASAYKMCVPTLSKLLNATARSRRAGPRACRLPDQLAWETLPGSAREGVSSYDEEGRWVIDSQFFENRMEELSQTQLSLEQCKHLIRTRPDLFRDDRRKR